MRFSVHFLFLLVVAAAAVAEPAKEWVFETEAMPQSPTLYPTVAEPTGVLVAAGQAVMLVNGSGAEQWRVSFEKPVANAPTAADLDGDGVAEIIGCLSDGLVYCLEADGRTRWERPFDTHADVFALIAAGDVHPEPGLELVFGFMDGWLHCLNKDGETLWRFFGNRYRVGPCALGDVDGDGRTEVVYGTDDGNIFCLTGFGEVKWRHNEFAPYGRSGVNLADLEGDGSVEVLLTRSNTGLDRCLMALDGATGKPTWRTNDVMQSYVSNAVADLDGDGALETLHADKGNWLYCTNADGTERWRTELAGRGIFWAPAVADVNGDGQQEIVVPMRDTDAKVGASHFLLAANGTVLEALKIGGSGNASPAVGDIDGDGELEVVVSTKGPNAIQVLSWGGRGAVQWASMRGDSDRTARSRCPAGLPAGKRTAGFPAGRSPDVVAHPSSPPQTRRCQQRTAGFPAGRSPAPPTIHLDSPNSIYIGENRTSLAWDKPAPKDAYLVVSSRNRTNGIGESVVHAVPEGATEMGVTWRLPWPSRSVITWELNASGRPPNTALARHRGKYKPEPPGYCDMETVRRACENAIAARTKTGVDTRGLQHRLGLLAATRERLRGRDSADAALAADASEMRKEAAAVLQLAATLEAFWEEGHRGSFLCWADANPWDRFNPREVPGVHTSPELAPTATNNSSKRSKTGTVPSERVREGDGTVPVLAGVPMSAPSIGNSELHVTAFGNEHEDAVLNMLNVSATPIDVRAAFTKPLLAGGHPAAEPELAKRVTLRRGVRVPGHDSGMVLDALPELDRSQTLTLAPGATAQLWLVIDTYGLTPGTHELTLYLGSLEQRSTLREVPITIEVWSVDLPVGVYAQMNWVGVDIAQTSDQQLKDMIDHGISVAYGPALPTIPLDKNGNVAGEIDWSRTDAALDRLPEYFQLLFHSPPRVRWPEGVQAADGDPLFEKGFATAVREMVRHLEGKGRDYDRWAYYPYDEPWLTGFTIIPQLRKFCERVKAADPNVRNYTDPTGLLRVEYVAKFKNLIDVWQPEMNILKRDPKLVRWFQENAGTFWGYEATDPGKDLLPLGYYRGYAWLAWMFGLQGAGFWTYKYHDIWWPLETTHWSVVYQNGNEVVPSRRWEAVRDGQEDYRALYALREEIERARGEGRTEDANRAQALLDEAVENVIVWQARTIDEITRQTRDYELDYELLMQYRKRIAEDIVRLRGMR